jgi:hypothetical protein
MKPVDCTGTRFGRLIAKERRPGKGNGGRVAYLCQCDCGNEKLVDYGNLQTGNTTSCGCFFLEVLSRRKTSNYLLRRNEILRYYRRNAKVMNREWALSNVEAAAILNLPCMYCGDRGPEGLGGIDRIDNSRGYESDNVAPACKRCNQARNDQTQEEFLNWIERVAHFQLQTKELRVA